MELKQISTLTRSLLRELRNSLFSVKVENLPETQKVEVVNPQEAQETVEVSNLIDVRPELKEIVKTIEAQLDKFDNTAQKKDIVKALKDLKTKPVKDLTPEVIKGIDKSVKLLEKLSTAKPDYSEIVKALDKEDDDKDPLEKYARFDEIKTYFNEKQLKELKNAIKSINTSGGSSGGAIKNQDGPITAANPLPVSATLNVGDIEIGAVELKDHDGTDRLEITTANAAKVDGSAVTQPVSATALPLPSGAATAIKQLADDHNVQISNKLIPEKWDYTSLAVDTLTDTWTFYTGGSGGTLVATVVITYTDAAKGTISNVAKT